MSKIVPYQLAAIKDIEKAIEEKAKHLQVHGPQKKVSVQKEKVKVWFEEKTEEYVVVEPRQKTVRVWDGDLGRITGKKKGRSQLGGECISAKIQSCKHSSTASLYCI